MSEEYFGINKSPSFWPVTIANTPWLVFPIIHLVRVLVADELWSSTTKKPTTSKKKKKTSKSPIKKN
jgi:hypothetical protein